MKNTSYYVGAYAIVHVPQRADYARTRECESGHNILTLSTYCGQCGAKTFVKETPYNRAATLYDIEEMGIEEEKYTQVHYTISSSIDEPFSNEPLVLISNSDDETDIDFDDSDDTLPYHIITDIKEEDIVRCKANFIRLYFDELRQLGETTVEFGILKRVEF